MLAHLKIAAIAIRSSLFGKSSSGIGFAKTEPPSGVSMLWLADLSVESHSSHKAHSATSVLHYKFWKREPMFLLFEPRTFPCFSFLLLKLINHILSVVFPRAISRH